MLYKKQKKYIVLLLIIISLLMPLCSFAFNEDSIYVWSNNSSSVSTSISPSGEESLDNSR